MIIKAKNFVLKLEEILKEDLPTERYNEYEKNVLGLIQSWKSSIHDFTHHTSGSTGRPKKIEISRDKIEISARATMRAIDPKGSIKHSLLCLNPQFIGGAMVVYRALIFEHDLTILEPSSDLQNSLDGSSFDLVSLAPIQFNKLSKTHIDRFKVVLIGGAPMPVLNTDFKSNVYSTFGMTETVSHIALRKIDEQSFKTTGDTIVSVDDDRSLKIKGSITDGKWLGTNDIVDIIDNKTFNWIGRKDFVINSGGIKINPEYVEGMIKNQFENEIMIGYLPDKKFGQKVVLLSESEPQEINFSSLSKYYIPKELFFNQPIFKTPNGKVDRLKTQSYFEKNQ